MNSAAANTLVAGLVPYLKDPWTLSWIISGLLAIFIPITIWSVHRNSYFNSYGSYIQAQDYYDNAKRYYEQQQENKNNYYNYNGNNNYYNGNQSNYKECSWINWACRKRQWQYATYSQDNNGDGNVNQQMPSWFIFFGGETEQMQRWREENNEDGAEGGRRNQSAASGGALNFVYFLTLGLFLTLVVFGAMIIKKRNTPTSSTTGAGSLMNMTHLTVFLVITMIIGLMNLIMTVGILSSGDEKDNEDSYYGWYGQTAVLVAYTDFWMMLFSFSFLIAFQIKNYINANYNNNGEQGVQTQQLDIHNAFTEERRNGGDYHAPTKV